MIAPVVSPVDHRYEAPALAGRVTLPPGPKVVGPEAVIVGVTGALPTTFAGALGAVQPFASQIVTV